MKKIIIIGLFFINLISYVFCYKIDCIDNTTNNKECIKMRCKTCKELGKYGYSNYPTTLIEKGLVITSYKGHEIKFKKIIVKCEECGELWAFEYRDKAYPKLLSSLNKIFEIEYKKGSSNCTRTEDLDKVMKDILVNIPITLKDEI